MIKRNKKRNVLLGADKFCFKYTMFKVIMQLSFFYIFLPFSKLDCHILLTATCHGTLFDIKMVDIIEK